MIISFLYLLFAFSSSDAYECEEYMKMGDSSICVISLPDKHVQIGNGVLNKSYSDQISGAIIIPSKLMINNTSYSVTVLSSYSFFGSNIESIEIPSSIIMIGDFCFSECQKLASINLSENRISIIPQSCFERCGICDIKFPKNLLIIGSSSFSHTNLVNLSFPPSLQTINSSSFSSCSKLISIDFFKTNLSYIGEKAFENNPLLVSVMFSKKLSFLGSFCFSHCGITSILLYKYVSFIGVGCFSYCEKLEYADLAVTSIKIIANTSFSHCSSLSLIIFPQSLISIGNEAFSFSGLLSIDMPSSLQIIDSSAFSQCHRLVTANFSTSRVKLFPSYCFYLCSHITNFVFPSALQDIGDHCFSSTNISCLVFGKKLRSLGNLCFAGCTNLRSVDLSKSCLSNISDYCFAHCFNLSRFIPSAQLCHIGESSFSRTGLTSFVFPASVTTILCDCFYNSSLIQIDLSNTSIKCIHSNSFRECINLNHIVLPSCLEILESSVFAVTSIQSVSFPSSLVQIGISCFANCPYLIDINLFNTQVLNLSSYAFVMCSSLVSLHLPQYLVIIGDGCFAATNVTDLVFPSTLQFLGALSFYSTKLRFINLSHTNLQIIEHGCFLYCQYLHTLILPNLIQFIANRSLSYTIISHFVAGPHLKFSQLALSFMPNLTFADLSHTHCSNISDRLFDGCSSLQKVILSKSVKCIGELAFGSTGLTRINFPKKLEYLGVGAFAATKLRNIDLSMTSIVTLTSFSFAKCEDLESIKFPSCLQIIERQALMSNRVKVFDFHSTHLKSLGEAVFHSCSCLEVIIFPNSIVNIGEYCFASCGIRNITIPVTVITIGEGIFKNCVSLQHADISSYQNTTIPEKIFLGCKNLTSPKLPHNYSIIGSYAFANSSLLEIKFPSSLQSIQDYAFFDCLSLKFIDLVDTFIESISDYMFSGCTSLNTVFIPQIKSLGIGSFSSTSINTFTFSRNLKSLGSYCFANCTGLSFIDLTSSEFTLIPAYCFANTSVSCLVTRNQIYTFEDGAFYNTSFVEFVTPYSVCRIGKHCFASCSKLQRFDLSPCNAAVLGDYALYNCSSLISFSFSDPMYDIMPFTFAYTHIKTIRFVASLRSLHPYAFFNCYYLTEIDFPRSVIRGIGDYCFFNCISLEKCVLPSSLNVIGKYAFYNSSIQNLHFPSGLHTLGFQCFSYSALTNINLNETEIVVFEGSPFSFCKIQVLLLPYKLCKLGSYAFCNTSIPSFSSNLQSIGDGAFFGCHSPLVDLSKCNFTSLPSQCFAYSNITKIKLMKSIHDFGESTFHFCTTNKLNFSLNNLTIIPDYYFMGLNVKKFVFSLYTISLGHSCFSYSIINNLEFPVSIVYFGSFCFQYSKIKTVNISNNNLEYLNGTFYHCHKLKNIYLPTNLKTINANTFSFCISLNIIQIPRNLNVLGDSSFINCSTLTKIDLSHTFIASISNTFYGCIALTTVLLPNTIRSIGEYTFSNTGLTDISLPSLLNNISIESFSNCKLKFIDFTLTQVLIIPPRAFLNCICLQTIKLHRSTQIISDDSFSGCNNIDTVYYCGSPSSLQCSSPFPSTAKAKISGPINLDFLLCGIPVEYDSFCPILPHTSSFISPTSNIPQLDNPQKSNIVKPKQSMSSFFYGIIILIISVGAYFYLKKPSKIDESNQVLMEQHYSDDLIKIY